MVPVAPDYCDNRPMVALLAAFALVQTPTLRHESVSVKAAGKTFAVQLIRVPIRHFRPVIGLAKGRMGEREDFAAIAKRVGAAAAVNGGFFQAYDSAKPADSYHTIISGGELVHLGNVGGVLGWDAQGNARLERLSIKVGGDVGPRGGARKFYAYRVNHSVSTSNYAGLLTHLGPPVERPLAPAILVENGKVTSKGFSGTLRPGQEALVFRGGEAYLADRFRVGDPVVKTVTYGSGDDAFWRSVETAIGCGPVLVRGGKADVRPESEGFTEAKITRNSGKRSFVGVDSRGDVVVGTTSATVRDLAAVALALDCREAMNLDGGASSGLCVGGKVVDAPSRPLASVLAFVPRS